ncbi:hypothetical protein NMG60_11020420 [Bertholletia excelsa]
MEHRHFTYSSRVLTDQGHNGNHLTAQESYIHMGRTAASQNGAFISPLDNTMRSGVHTASQWNFGNRLNEYTPSFSMEVPHTVQAFPGASYNPFLQSSASGNLYLGTHNDVVGHGHSSYYGRCNGHGNEGSLLGPVTSGGRGPFKRKSPGIPEAHERGSTSRYYNAGSSSSLSQLPHALEKSNSDYHNIPSSHISLPHFRDGNLFFSGECSLRNVRSRSRLDLGANTMQTHSSSYTSYHYRPTANSSRYPGAADISSMNGEETTRDWNFNTLAMPPQGRTQTSVSNGLNHENNQFLVRENSLQAGGCPTDSVPNRNLVSSSQYLHALPIRRAREGRGNHSQRLVTPYRTGPSYQPFRHDAASAENGLHLPSETYSSRYSRPSFGGWHNTYRNGRSRITTERFQSLSGVVDTSYRIGYEGLTTMDHSSLYASSRNLFDQYGDMRLDIDNMSYEELLALGESMGNVSTGLSEEMISKCLIERKNSDISHEDGRCCICLEEYSDGDKVGTLKKCGHNYHVSCIRTWLLMKNSCPICKASCLTDCLEE